MSSRLIHLSFGLGSEYLSHELLVVGEVVEAGLEASKPSELGDRSCEGHVGCCTADACRRREEVEHIAPPAESQTGMRK